MILSGIYADGALQSTNYHMCWLFLHSDSGCVCVLYPIEDGTFHGSKHGIFVSTHWHLLIVEAHKRVSRTLIWKDVAERIVDKLMRLIEGE